MDYQYQVILRVETVLGKRPIEIDQDNYTSRPVKRGEFFNVYYHYFDELNDLNCRKNELVPDHGSCNSTDYIGLVKKQTLDQNKSAVGFCTLVIG